MGMGAFDEEDLKFLHMLGMHGSAYANLAMQDADVIIALGVRFDDQATGRVDAFVPRAALVQSAWVRFNDDHLSSSSSSELL
ncbi:uncharacterized protein MELLADRAFT_85497 [Melampsora larici-populina 98AG31]|uniref:Thiamine pyrophosphate enzyme central domain-containing protein n=1 Tax=Melampsora larici-populina (strain 98AG31 / pathotype 3-4-7) TaxID=747676 RepID=F4RIX8_MELLP|nr:uncharacterized protein MELLADRAFT_85497 [Melampsora larici-populina 98AG31]EGG07754.1 hypothetical protein MELLADRAFT_85497 [Melampsora larici-populina 98AG31]